MATALLAGCLGPDWETDPERTGASLPFSRLERLHERHAQERSRRHVLRVGADAPAMREQVEALGGRIEWWHGPTGLATVGGLDAWAVAELRQDERVHYVAPDGLIGLLAPPSAPELLGRGGSEGPTSSDGDEPAEGPVRPSQARRYGHQWHMRAIGAPAAWRAGRLGSPDVTVAVVDSGIDYEHVDLRGRVDLSRSISFVETDDELVAEHFPDRHPVTDLNNHGTHVAATIASNAVMAAGVTARVTLIGVKVAGAEGEVGLSQVLQGVVYAVDEGADVVNLSIGATFPEEGNERWIDAIHTALGHAWANGVTVVAGAGNGASDMDDDDLYRALCSTDLVVCTAATGPTRDEPNDPHAHAPYSNRGAVVDLAAPGGNAKAVWAACSGTSLRTERCRGQDDMIVGMNGTSMATPHVTGLVALLVETDEGPGYWQRSVRVRRQLERTLVDEGASGRDPLYGIGRIDVAQALGL